MSISVKQPRYLNQSHFTFLESLGEEQQQHPEVLSVLLRKKFHYLDKVTALEIAVYWLSKRRVKMLKTKESNNIKKIKVNTK